MTCAIDSTCSGVKPLPLLPRDRHLAVTDNIESGEWMQSSIAVVQRSGPRLTLTNHQQAGEQELEQCCSSHGCIVVTHLEQFGGIALSALLFTPPFCNFSKIVAMIASSQIAIEICTLRLLRQLAEDQACQTSEALQRTRLPLNLREKNQEWNLGFLKFDGPNEEFYDTRQVHLVQYF